jgi:replicative DNA helicase
MFDNEIYRNIAEKAIKYYKTYKRPVKKHLPDVLEKKIKGDKNSRESQAYTEIINGLAGLSKEVDPEFVIKELKKFVHERTTILTLKNALQLYQEGRIEEIDKVFNQRDKSMLEVFDPGLRFGRDMKRTLAFLHTQEEMFYTGIPYLDRLGIVPVRKELFVFVGLPGTGKSWGLTHIGKVNSVHRLTIAHVSLEMSEMRCSQRYVQSYLGISKRNSKVELARLLEDETGMIYEMKLDELSGVWSVEDTDIESKIIKKLNHMMRPRLFIKQFPTGMLSIEGLVSYIENLRVYENVIPDILIVDYADLMSIDAKNLRVETGKIYQQLRGLAIEYDMSVVTASQANRTGIYVTTLTRKHLAEDFSKVAIADNVITYNQTPNEKQVGLARLYIDKARNDRTGDSIILAQNYNIGQFCVQSALMKKGYFEDLEKYFPDRVTVEDKKMLSAGRVRLSQNLTWKVKRKANEAKKEDED